MHRKLLLLLLLAVPLLSIAQAATAEIAEVNTRFGGAIVFKLDRRQQLVMDHHDANGRYRQDVVPVEHLDIDATTVSLSEHSVVLTCRADRPQCISKELFAQNAVRMTGRSALALPPGDADGAATLEAVRALIAAAQARLATNETRR